MTGLVLVSTRNTLASPVPATSLTLTAIGFSIGAGALVHERMFAPRLVPNPRRWGANRDSRLKGTVLAGRYCYARAHRRGWFLVVWTSPLLTASRP